MEYNIENDYYNPYRPNNKNNKQHKINKVIIAVLIIVLLVSIVIFKKVYINKVQETNSQIKDSQEIGQKLEIEQGAEKDENSSQENKNPIIIDVNENEKEDEKKNNQDTPTNATPEKSVEKPKGETPPKTPSEGKVGLDYFKDAVFIGDSRTEGFILNNGLASKTISYTSKGLQVNTIFTDRVINMDGKKVTIMEALENTSFSKVYIMLGINETGWVYNDLFIKKYTEIIDEIKRINPNCKIYVQSILPVSQKVSDEHKYIKNAKINEYNSLLEQMAKNKNVYYINVREAVVNQNNVLSEDAATDGIHLNKKYCEKWLEYLISHTV